MREVWKDIPSCPGYQASNAGRIRSLDRIVVGKDGKAKRFQGITLRAFPNKAGYLCIRVGRNNPTMVHRLVAEAFFGPCPKGMYVCHNNNDRGDSRPSNLRYDSPKNNQQDRKAHGTYYRGERMAHAILTEAKVRRIKKALASKSITHKELAAKFGVSRPAISAIAAGRNWAHVEI